MYAWFPGELSFVGSAIEVPKCAKGVLYAAGNNYLPGISPGSGASSSARSWVPLAIGVALVAGVLWMVARGAMPVLSSNPSFKIGDRVRVRGKPHAAGHVAGTVQEVGGTAYGIRFDGTSEVHRWYTGTELERLPAANPGVDEVLLLGAIGASAASSKKPMGYAGFFPPYSNPGLPDGVAKRKGFEEKDADPKELRMGIEHELEHTSSRKVAKQIALDHLAETADYYTRLKKIEKNPSNGAKLALAALLIPGIPPLG